MKRDCGKGELIPVKFSVVHCVGKSDEEFEHWFKTLPEALEHFEIKVSDLKDLRCSDVRLYAHDKQKYANCIKSWIHSANGSVHVNDRTKEL